jgi:SAM-dependent methyltransferase
MRGFYPERRIVQCPDCELVFYAGSPEATELYETEYFAGGEYQDYEGDKAILQRNFRKQVSRLLRLAQSGRLLEIGSAYGFFLELARTHWDVEGVDISQEGVRHCRNALGLKVSRGDFLDLPDQAESFDLICLWDTIEHLPRPVRTIEKAARWLKPGGALLMTTGDIGSLVARVRKARWRQVHPPTHLFYFSRKTLARAVERAGLRVQSASSIGYWRSLRSMLYGIFALGEKRTGWIFRVLTAGGRLDLPVYLNLYDIFLMTARKPAETSVRGSSRNVPTGPTQMRSADQGHADQESQSAQH